LKERLDTEHTEVTAQLAETEKDIKRTNYEKSVFPFGVNKAIFSSGHRHFGKILKLSGNKIICIYRKASNHISNDGEVAYVISNDGGGNFSSENVVYSHGTLDCRVGAIGITKTGRIIVVFSIQDTLATPIITNSMGYIYSDDEGETWSDFQTIEIFNNEVVDYAIPYGTVVQIGNRLLFGYYQKNKDGTRFLSVRTSEDNGTTWSASKTITSGVTDFNETDFVVAGANTLVGVTRVGAGGTFRQFVSTDSGDTWTDQGDTNTDNNRLVAPSLTPVIFNNEQYVILHYVDRTFGALIRKIARVSDLVDSPQKWRHLGGVLYSAPNASGYQSCVQDSQGKLMLLYFRETDSSNTTTLLLSDNVGQNHPYYESDWFEVAVNTTYNIPLVKFEGIPNAVVPPKHILVTFKTDSSSNHEWVVQQVHTDGQDGHGCSISFDTSNIYVRTGVTNVIKAGGTRNGINATTGLYKVRVWY